VTSERLTLALADSTTDFLIVLDEAGALRYANPAFTKKLLGGRPAAGTDLLQLVDHASAERARNVVSATLSAKNGETHQVELFHFEPDGRAHPVFYTFSRVEGGVAAVGHDKTADLELLGEIVQLNIQLEEKQTELADANVRLEQLAITDQITGLYNRHHFFDVVQHTFEEARRYKLPLCCFMLDVDHFKVLNDTHGHMFGDQVLRGIGDRLRQNTRRSDVLARYGGEEFVMIAPNTDLDTAKMLAERLHSCIEKDPFTLGKISAHVTISLGVAGTETVKEGPFDDLLVAADQALYFAKQSGRNRYHLYTSGDPGITAATPRGSTELPPARGASL
jgi:diguanylate cyclase (GGDEF)-like protein